MNKSILLLIPLLLCSFQQPEDNSKLKVIKVIGTIVIKDTQKLLSTGDEINSKLPLNFKSSDARAAVINMKNKSRYVLTSDATSNDGSTGVSAKTHLIPSAITVSSRGVSLHNVVDIQNYFTGNFVVLDRMKMKISSQVFPMNSDHIFYVQYRYKGEDINKKLDFSNDSLEIDKEKIFLVDGKPIVKPDDTKIKLFYMEGNKSTLINEFDLLFPEGPGLKKEIDVFWDPSNTKTYSVKVDDVVSYINEFYGKTDRDNVMEWLSRNF
jgi:hypothetical protein